LPISRLYRRSQAKSGSSTSEKDEAMKMTTEEAFVKVLQMHGIEHAFGIIGSAFMPISDLFPAAGITFWDVAHECNGGIICDGYTRSTGKMAMVTAQNGPGITNLVTPIKTAYWNHTPMLLVTPQAANRTIGQGGFQEVEQMALFRDMVAYQEEVRDPVRVAEVLNRVIAKAKRLSAPAQINIPRDLWTQVIDINLPAIVEFERPAGGVHAVAEAAKLLSAAKFPVLLSGAGVILGDAIPECTALAERLDAPVCSNYQHNDSFPSSHRLALGPLGYNGSKAAMEIIAKADVVLALGTRLNPFSTLPGYGIDYWPNNAKIIQVDINADRIGLTKPVAVGICGDAKLVAKAILAQLSPAAGNEGREERKALVHTTKSRWLQALSSMDHEEDDAGTTWNADAQKRDPDRMTPRRDRQRLSDLREGPQISGARPVRAVRLRVPGDHRRQDRQSGHALRRLRRRRRVRHFHERDEFDRARRMARHHHGGVPQLSMGRGEAQFDPVVRRQFRRHRA
jgi:sulfoacetaldehyde acetyltransferase